MAHRQYTDRVVSKLIDDIESGFGYSASTKQDKVNAYLTIPSQGSIKIQAITGNKKIVMFARGYEIINDSGNEGIDVSISLFQGCTSDTNDSDVTVYNLNNDEVQSDLLINKNPLNVVLGEYRGDLSTTVFTENKEVVSSVNLNDGYTMPLNEKDILEIENFNLTNDLKIALSWKFIER